MYGILTSEQWDAMENRLRGSVFMVVTVESMQERQQELQQTSEQIIQLADGEGRELTEEEVDQIEQNATEIEKIGKQIQARQNVSKLQQAPGPVSRPAVQEQRRVPAQVRVDPRTGGFKHLGEFGLCVKAAAIREDGAINRLLQMGEGSGEDGGYLVPSEFREPIIRHIEGETSLMSRCDTSTTARNSVTQNFDSETPWGTAGIVAYWEAEAAAAAASNAHVAPVTLRLNKLFARVDVSDELLDDAPQLDSLLRTKAPEVITSVLNLAIVQGNGVGKPLGFMNSPSLVTVAKYTSQPADTIFHNNLVSMMGRMYAPSWPRAVWLMHQDVWAKLHLLSFRDVGSVPTTSAVAPEPIFMPPTTLLSGAPFGMLLGRPIVVLEAMETIGDLGDIALVDLSQYRVITKTGGPRVDTSIHLKFDTDETVFRFIFRVAGAPTWNATVSPRDGSNDRSPFVTLASR